MVLAGFAQLARQGRPPKAPWGLRLPKAAVNPGTFELAFPIGVVHDRQKGVERVIPVPARPLNHWLSFSAANANSRRISLRMTDR